LMRFSIAHVKMVGCLWFMGLCQWDGQCLSFGIKGKPNLSLT